jgi:hypothetical protein
MPTYSVVLYFNPATMQFSVTARKTDGARLVEVDAQQQALGFSRQVVARGLGKAAAIQLKRKSVAAQKAAGYRQVSRPQL